MLSSAASGSFPAVDRKFLQSDENLAIISAGALGGKALSLAFVRRVIGNCGPPPRRSNSCAGPGLSSCYRSKWMAAAAAV